MRRALFAVTLILMGLFLISCGSEKIVETVTNNGPQGEQGEMGEPGETVVVEVPTLPEFVGEYYLPFSGYVIINVNHEDEYSVTARYETLNPDDSICVLSLNGSTIDLHNDILLYGATVSLVSGNCDDDTTGAALSTGSGRNYRYEVVIGFNDDDLLTVNLQVFQTRNGVTTRVINRDMVEE